MVIGFLIRTGVVVGAVYYTRNIGVWGNSEQTEKIYNNIKDQLRPHAKELTKNIPFDVPQLPTRGEVYFLANHYYNRGVKGTFHFIEMIPCYMGQMLQKVKKTVDDFSQSPQPASVENK